MRRAFKGALFHLLVLVCLLLTVASAVAAPSSQRLYGGGLEDFGHTSFSSGLPFFQEYFVSQEVFSKIPKAVGVNVYGDTWGDFEERIVVSKTGVAGEGEVLFEVGVKREFLDLVLEQGDFCFFVRDLPRNPEMYRFDRLDNYFGVAWHFGCLTFNGCLQKYCGG